MAPIEPCHREKRLLCGQAQPLNDAHCLDLAGVHSQEAAIIGDRMDTDILAGIECGLDTALVLSGVSTRDTVTLFPYRPRLILNGVGDIAEAAAQPN